MDRLQAMRVFSTVVESGSFAQAAEQLNLSATATSRYVAELEKHLGAQLLQRSTRRLNLTDIGSQYLERCRLILADIEEAEMHAASAESLPRGQLRLSLPHSFGLLYVAPLIPEFCTRYPEMQVELNFSDRTVDLVEEGVDLAVRITSDIKTSLIARRLAPVKLYCCASPRYLAERGTPQTPEDLRHYDCITYSYAPSGNHWQFKQSEKQWDIPVKSRLKSNSGDMSRLAALNGLGIALLPSFLICNELRSKTLIPVLEDFAQPDAYLYAAYLPGARRAMRIRAMVDFLQDKLGQDNAPWLTLKESAFKDPTGDSSL